MIYRLVLTLMLGGSPQELVGATEFPTLKACNEKLGGFIEARIAVNWIATCRVEYAA